jgi:hypothetical protein
MRALYHRRWRALLNSLARDAAMIGPFSASAAYTALTQDIVSSQNDKETTDLSAFTP